MADIREAVPADMQTFWDMTISAYWGWSCWDARQGQFHSAQGAGGLGYGFPAAIGGAVGLETLGRPGRVLAVSGDGSSMYSISELATAKQHNIPVTWLIVDDGGYGILREYMVGAFGKATATELARPDFVKLAEAFGVPATRVAPEDVGDALKAGFAADGPNVVVVETLLKMFGPTHLDELTTRTHYQRELPANPPQRGRRASSCHVRAWRLRRRHTPASRFSFPKQPFRDIVASGKQLRRSIMAVAPDTAADLVYRIFDLQRAVRCVAAASFRGQDTGVALQGVLRFVGEGETRATQLAERLGVSAPVLSRHIADLEEQGYVIRRQDPDDGRAQLVALSPAGAEKLRRIEEHRTATLQGLPQRLEPGGRRRHGKDPRKLSESLKQSARAKAAGPTQRPNPRGADHGEPRRRRSTTTSQPNPAPPPDLATLRTRRPAIAMTHRQIMEALTGLLAAFFTAILSSTIVANALPTIMSELHGTQTDFAWVITAALLANAATTPIWGKLADLFNKKLLVQLSIVIFVAGSVMAGLSETIPLLLTARVIQGVAMGGLTALAQAIIGSMIPPRDRGKYSGYMGGVMAVGTAGGPLLGGFIVDSPLGWRWTFFVCVPLAVVALILLQVTLKIQHIKRPAKIDWLGSILLTSGVSLLLIWVSFAGNPDYYDWLSWQSAPWWAAACCCWPCWCWWNPRWSSPSSR